MVTAKSISKKPRLDELAGVRAAIFIRFSYTILRQVKFDAR